MKATVLIVDDNATNTKLAADVLEGDGCSVERAADAEEAQQILERLHPDVILMDIALPGMDGLSLTRKLKLDARLSDIPIVALTASAMKPDEARALAAGCQGYITKPIDTRRFARQVLAFVPRAAERIEAQLLPAVRPRETQRILIVDDLAQNLRLLRAGLEAEGFDVLEASNGAEALRVLDSEAAVDAIISDILMPVMDGFRLCKEIRRSSRPNAQVPFILYTATYDSPGDRELANLVGADGYVLKPAPIPVLLEALRAAGATASQRVRAWTAPPDEANVLEQYSAALVRKLEERNGELQRALAELQTAHEEILALNRNLEGRVAQRTAALDSANRELDAFSHSVAHDLRAPLRTIGGFVELLEEATASTLTSESLGFLRHIREGAQKMDQLIMGLLSYSRTSREELRVQQVDLNEVLTAAIATVTEDCGVGSIEWRRAGLPSTRGDATALQQVFVNILSNAVKYSRGRETVQIEIGSRSGRDGETVISIKDNGVGFDMKYAANLFGLFRRLHRASEFEGTGVGLATAQRIVSRHGGRMWAEAEVERGATFFFSLPGAEPVPARADHQSVRGVVQ
jgi:CheY-like chemotaxis protein